VHHSASEHVFGGRGRALLLELAIQLPPPTQPPTPPHTQRKHPPQKGTTPPKTVWPSHDRVAAPAAVPPTRLLVTDSRRDDRDLVRDQRRSPRHTRRGIATGRLGGGLPAGCPRPAVQSTSSASGRGLRRHRHCFVSRPRLARGRDARRSRSRRSVNNQSRVCAIGDCAECDYCSTATGTRMAGR